MNAFTKEAMESYRQLLKSHDWSHEMSDDHEVVRRGWAERKALRELQKELDPDFKIWNELCHPYFKDDKR